MIEYVSNEQYGEGRREICRSHCKRRTAIIDLTGQIASSNAWPLNVKNPHVTIKLRESHQKITGMGTTFLQRFS